MMSSQRFLGFTLVCVLLTAALWWWSWRPAAPPASVSAVATATVVAALPTPATPAAQHAPPGYRLAGVAVGEPDSFAVVEAPNGKSALYRLDADVPGLGRLVRIDAERILVQGDSGPVELWVAPAPTATPAPSRSTATRTPTAKPRPQTPAGGTPRGSTPSAARGSPVS